MYPITKEALELFLAEYRQTLAITMHGLDGNITLTDSDVISGGFSVNRYSVSGSRIELGSVSAAEVNISLDNSDGRFDDIRFEGAELYIQVGIKKWDAHRWENAVMHYVPMGYFTVDEVPRRLKTINLTALDRMVCFDKAVDPQQLSFPTTAGALLERICEICDVLLATPSGSLTNSGYLIPKAPDMDNLTYRQLLSWIAELTGTCAYIGWDGKLRLSWYAETDTVLTPSCRFDSDVFENNVTITGVRVCTAENASNGSDNNESEPQEYTAGTQDYAFNIEGNGLIQHSPAAIANALYSKLNGFSYTPFSATVKPMPHLYPLDMAVFKDKNGADHTVIITNHTFTLNANTEIEGKGETGQKNGYAALNPMTKREQSIVEKLKNEQIRELTNREQALLELNEAVCNSIGLRTTEVIDDSGGVIRYFHDGSDLESSNVIYTMRSGGFAWTNEWQGDDTVWQYGFTRDGNAVLNILSAYKIKAEQIDVEYTNGIEQAFHVGLGELESQISAEVARATAAEISMSSKIMQNAAGISLCVTKSGLGEAVNESGVLSDYVTTSALDLKATEIRASVQSGGGDGFYYYLDDYKFNVGQINDFGFEQPVLSVNKDGASITNAFIGNCTISDNCTINGTLTANQIHSKQEPSFMSGNFYNNFGSISFNLVDVLDSYNYPTGDKYAEYRFEARKEKVEQNNFTSTVGQSSLTIAGGGAINLYGSQVVALSAGNFGTLSGNWVNGSGQTIVSDPDCKNSISDLSDGYNTIFDNLRPVSYKYNDGTSGRIHTGFIATEVQEAISSAGLTEQDFAAVCTLPYKHPASVSGKENTVCIRYDEIIALNTWQIQKLKSEVAALKEKIKEPT